MFNNLLNYYMKNTQKRINDRIEAINEKRITLRKSGNISYKSLKSIKNSHLYANRPKIIKSIRESEPNEIIGLLTLTVAKSIVKNLKVKPNLKTSSVNIEEETKMKTQNLEFTSLQELYFGFDLEYTDIDKFEFFLNLFLDLKINGLFWESIQSVLKEYIPYAVYCASEQAFQENYMVEELFNTNFRDKNIDVFAESVFLFCQTPKSNIIMERFVQFLHDGYSYDSKDSEGRYIKKNEIINFKNFNEALKASISFVLEPILEIEIVHSLGERAYNIILEDFRVNTDLYFNSIFEHRRGPFTKTDKLYFDVLVELALAGQRYIEEIKKIQYDLYGNIESEYFNSEVFREKATSFFSERRFELLSYESSIKKDIENDRLISYFEEISEN